jgi:hypothetical protein
MSELIIFCAEHATPAFQEEYALIYFTAAIKLLNIHCRNQLGYNSYSLSKIL